MDPAPVRRGRPAGGPLVDRSGRRAGRTNPRRRRAPAVARAGLIGVAALATLTACGGADGTTATGIAETDGATATTTLGNLTPGFGGSGGGGPARAGTRPATDGLPVTLTDDEGHEVTVTSSERIIPLDGDVAEVVFALGLGPSVVATDLSATFPPEADALPEIGYQRALSAEPIVAMDPTVLLATDLAGPTEALDQLRSIGIPLVIVPAPDEPTGPATKIRAVAAALGVPSKGAALAAEVEAGIDAARAEADAAVVRDGRPRVMALYLRGGDVQIVFGKGSGIDWVIEAAGGTDVGTELGIEGNAPLTTESMLVAAPDVILASTTGIESVGGVEQLRTLAGIDRTPAAASGRILAYEDQYLFGGGPRTDDLLRELTAQLHPDPGSTPSRRNGSAGAGG